MRYQNWDVLIFPEDCKIPIQEFKTACFVVQDSESTQLQASAANSLPYSIDYTSPIQLPTVSSFIHNLPFGFPFRVSIHSWETPQPSRTVATLMQAHRSRDIVVFEARIYLDGVCVASTLFQDQGPWPQVIESTSERDKNGNVEKLRFPPFHNEILSQNWWNVSENLGRIKVVISEGFIKGSRDHHFERVKNKVAFSFQHAPLDILESSGIAWPNPGMWHQLPMPTFLRGVSPLKPDEEAHAHSPRGRSVGSIFRSPELPTPIPFKLAHYSTVPSMLPPVVGGLGFRHLPSAQKPDPFLDSYNFGNLGQPSARESFEDQVMLDYSHSATPASSRSATQPQRNHAGSRPPSVHGALHDNEYDQLIEALSPLKEAASGTYAPANTRMSSTHSAIAASRPSAAAEARAASYTKASQRSNNASTEPAQPAEREVSDVSMKSRFSEEVEQKDILGLKVHKVPAPLIKGKKEGKDVETTNSLSASRFASTSSVENEGKGSATKRKRSREFSSMKPASTDDEMESSPSRKVSKMKRRSGHNDYKGSESSVDSKRIVLESLTNTQ